MPTTKTAKTSKKATSTKSTKSASTKSTKTTKPTVKKTGGAKTSIKKASKSEVQSVLFDNTKYAGPQAVSWLRKHNFKAPVNPDKTAHMLHYRQTSPKKYKQFATIAVPGTTGVKFVLGIK